MCTSTVIWGVGRPVTWFRLGCSNDPALELEQEGFILPQVINEDFVESVERDEIAARVPEEVTTSRQEIDSCLGCGKQSAMRSDGRQESSSQRYSSC